MMKIGRLWLCYPDMDRIIIDKIQDLAKYDLSKVSSIDVRLDLSVDEFLHVKNLVEQKKSLLP